MKGVKGCHGALPVTDYVLPIIFLSNYKSPRSAHATRDSPIGRGSVLF